MARKKNNEIRTPREVQKNKRMSDGMRWADKIMELLKEDTEKQNDKGE